MAYPGKAIVAAVAALMFAGGAASVAVSWHGNAGFPPPRVSADTVADPSAIPWDAAHRTDLLQIKSQADTLAIQGQWREAYDAYQHCITLTADHELTDPVVVGTVSSAQQNQERLLDLLSRAQPGVATTPAPVSAVQAPEPSRLALAAPVGNSPAVHPLPSNDEQTDPPAPLPAHPGLAGGRVASNAPSSDNLFAQRPNPAVNRPRRRDGDLSGSQPSSLESGSNLPDTFQPFTGSDPLPVPDRIVVTKIPPPGKPAQPDEVSLGDGPQHVWVIVGTESNGKGPVSGSVDGHPFTIGGPGEPFAVLFTGLPAGTIPVFVGSQEYSYNGTTIHFTFPGDGQGSTSPSPKSLVPAPVPTSPSPTSITPLPVVPPKGGGSHKPAQRGGSSIYQ